MYQKIESEKHIAEVSKLARSIWMSYFNRYFSRDVLEYIVEYVQSIDAITEQIAGGCDYFFIKEHAKTIGYFAYKLLPGKNEMFLSKIYIIEAERGKGIGKNVFSYLNKVCQTRGIKKISLTVYHGNSDTIKAYEKMGFQKSGLIERDIGNAIILRDYTMIKEV